MNNISEAGNEASHPIQIPHWKRILDIVLILLALPVLVPIGIFIGVLISLLSPGPILFRQERVGFKGGRFVCLKFRTMQVRAEPACHQGHLDNLINSDAPMVKLDTQGDSRIIPVGLLLRSSGLDELPQLINVLRGEMSLVGPRPCMPYEYARYLPWQMERFSTLPGLTGLWQVSGKNRTTFTEMMELDIRYARTKSLSLDLGIILKTLPVMVGQVWDSFRRRHCRLTQPPLMSQLDAKTKGVTASENQKNELSRRPRNFGVETQSN